MIKRKVRQVVFIRAAWGWVGAALIAGALHDHLHFAQIIVILGWAGIYAGMSEVQGRLEVMARLTEQLERVK